MKSVPGPSEAPALAGRRGLCDAKLSRARAGGRHRGHAADSVPGPQSPPRTALALCLRVSEPFGNLVLGRRAGGLLCLRSPRREHPRMVVSGCHHCHVRPARWAAPRTRQAPNPPARISLRSPIVQQTTELLTVKLARTPSRKVFIPTARAPFAIRRLRTVCQLTGRGPPARGQIEDHDG